MEESDNAAASKHVESTKSGDEFQYLTSAGLTISVDSIKEAFGNPTVDLSAALPRLSDSVTVTNGMIADACKILHLVQVSSVESTFSFFCHLLPESSIDSLGSALNFWTVRIKPFKKKLLNLQKSRGRNPKALEDFLNEEFVLVRHEYNYLTPRRKKLKKENIRLREKESKLTEKFVAIQDDLQQLRKQSDLEAGKSKETALELEDVRRVKEQEHLELLQTKEAVLELEEDLRIKEQDLRLSEEAKTPLQKIAGFQSGASRRRISEKTGKSTTFEASRSPPTPTDFAGKDFIVIESQEGNIITGKKYHGSMSGRQSTTGHLNKYIAVDGASKPCSTTTSVTIHNKVQQLDSAAMVIAGGTAEEKRLLYTHLLRSDKELFEGVLKDAGFRLLTKMQPDQGVQLQSMLRLSTYAFRNLRRALDNLDMNVLPSEGEMVKKEKLVDHVKRGNAESGVMGLHKTVKDPEPSECAFVRVKSLKDFISVISQKDPAGYRFDEGFDGKWWILFSGDKGGDHMKFHVEIINSNKAGSVDCMYEAQDSIENMRKVWNIYRQQVKDMYADSFRLHGREVVIFLGGDYHFLDDMVGHQGSSASFPSHLDYVTLQHLQNHGKKPHTPDNCGSEIQLRTVQEYQNYYDQNLSDDRREGDMKLTGKYHYSIAAPMIFPIADLANIVPPSLHIMLGITLVFYNLLLETCQKLDETNVDAAFVEEKKRQENLYEELSIEADEIDRSLRAHGADVITTTNHANRLQAIMDGNHAENEATAKSAVGDKRIKPVKQKEIEKCKIGVECGEEWCFVTKYDSNLNWVQCDTCDHWFHAMCEGIPPSAEAALTNMDYHCRQCTSMSKDKCNVDRLSELEETISKLIAKEEVLNSRLVDIEIEVDGMKARYSKYSGPRETSLEAALSNMKVQRQAYHSNVIVGNHCLIVLERHKELREVIDQPNYAHFNEVFEIFNESMKYIMHRGFLEPWKIEKLESLCVKLGEVFPIYFPDRNITRKIHEHIMNVPRFVRRHGTIGLLSEQEGESKHSSIKNELRSLVSVRDRAERLRLALEREELRSASSKELFKPKVRLCQKCRPKRIFLRAGKDKKKRCTVCEPSFFNSK